MNAGRWGRALVAAGIVGSAAAGLAVTGGWFWLRSSVQPLDGVARVPGLEARVTVLVDPFSIPHLFASTEQDLFRAQGWLHASERLWQMEVLRRTAAGRLAELFGERALEVDRFVRTLDLGGAAERSLDAMPAETRERLEAYAEGVNARLRSWRGALPPEFVLLRFRPEPWRPHETVAVGKLMTLDLSHWSAEVSRFVASGLLDRERLRHLRLPYPEWGPTILPESAAGGEGSEGLPPEGPGAGSQRAAARGGGGWSPREFLGGLAAGTSNAWAVAGVRSESGFPLLANDMHLPLRAPSTWYLAALHAESDGLHVAGLTLPGVPGVVVGYNRHLAWGFTNGMVDDMDFVVEAPSLDRTRYREGGAWRAFAVRAETLRVRGRERPVVHEVRETVRGPVLSDVLDGVDEPLSVLWVGRLATAEAVGLLAMNRATDAVAFDRAVRRFEAPHQNVIYATARGRIGYRLAGTVPIREGWDGSLPAPAHVVGRGWRGVLSDAGMPATVGSPNGYLATANHLQGSSWFGVIGIDYPVPFRARRIVDRLEEEFGWTRERMGELQLDVRSGFADRVIGRAAAAAERIGADSLAGGLRAWDRRVELSSREATVFHAWLYRLRELIAADEWRQARAWEFFPDRALLEILETGGGAWVDDVSTPEVESLRGLEEQAMVDAVDVAAGRRWGEIHRERSVHLLGGSAWLDRIFGFHVGPYPAPGGPHTVRPDDPRRWQGLDASSWMPPYLSEYGPSQRFVAELRPGRSGGWFLLPTGQSGNPFSPHYRDMAARWPASELVPIPIDRTGARARAVRALQLEPDRAGIPSEYRGAEGGGGGLDRNPFALTGSHRGGSLGATAGKRPGARPTATDSGE